MDDWIERDAILSDIDEKIESSYGYPEDALINKGLRIARREIANAPAVSCWTPCSEQLPEINAEVLVTLRKPELGGYFRKIGRFLGDKWLINNIYAASRENVIAWMPLPDVPEEVKQNDDLLRMQILQV